MSPPQKHVPRVRKQKARQRAEAAQSGFTSATADSNAIELLPVSASEREEKRRRLREEYRAAKPETKTSAKKRKRLDKYIDTKLKKEESADLIRKLAAQGSIDTSLLRSSKKLGRGDETKRELLSRTLRERRAGLGNEEDDDLLMEERKVPRVSDIPAGLADGHRTNDSPGPVPQAQAQQRSTPSIQPQSNGHSSETAATMFGGGLKRPLELDESGRPVIKKRKTSKVKPKSWEVPVATGPFSESEDSGDDWEGFDSESDGSNIGSSEDGLAGGEGGGTDGSSEDEEEDATTDTSVEDNEAGTDDDEQARTDDRPARKERSNAFKAWATQQRDASTGFQPSNTLDAVPRPKSTDTSSSSQATDSASAQERHNESALPKVPEFASSAPTAFHVPVQRTAEIDEARLALPVVAEEQKIMEAIRTHDTIIVCGSTGSGKTTQVPQFLFEAGYGSPEGPTRGLIGVTQPRRVAAVSMAKRVATELGDQGSKVAHQIRFDSTVSHSTAIKFMTDGVLLREVGQDFTLSKYSVIVLDEAHERSVNTDILIGMLSRVVETRAKLSKQSSSYKPLKLVIMSATLKTADLLDNERLFRAGKPPIVEAEGRQHPVATHFARRTERDYMEQAFSKISRGHKKLPQGAMLVFLTGQNEIQQLAKRLRSTFTSTDGAPQGFGQVRVSAAETSLEDEDFELGLGHAYDVDNDEDSDSDAEIHGLDNDEDKEFDIGEDVNEVLKVHILPLYSQLPTEQQMRIFETPPDGSRMIVLATNVAETSLTIPGVRYVFDCGRAKEKQYSPTTGVQSFDITWISKASASQRAGRAGRTGPGHCYRLYSSAVYERDFAEFAEPEVARTPVEGVVLQLKSMGIPNVANFPFPTAPNATSLVKAERLLEYLGALSNGKVTDLGRQLSLYPLSPRLAKMLCVAQTHNVTDATVLLVAALTVGDIFIPESQLNITSPPVAKEDDNEPWTKADHEESQQREQKRKEYNTFHAHTSRHDRLSDAVKLQTLMRDFLSSGPTPAYRTFTRIKALQEALNLRDQLTHIVSTCSPRGSQRPRSTPSNSQPTKADLTLLRSIVASGYIDHLAIRADLSPTPPPASEGRSAKPKRAAEVPYVPLFPLAVDPEGPSTTIDEEDTETAARRKYIYIHPSSLLSHLSVQKMPQYLIYSHLSTPTAHAVGSTRLPRTRLHPLTPISGAQILDLARGTPLVEEGKPIGKIEVMERDEGGRERRGAWCVPFLVPGAEKGGVGTGGWPVPPARRVTQVRDGKRGWVNEEEI